MQPVRSGVPFIGRLMAGVFMLAAAGCQSSDTGGLLGMGNNAKPDRERITSEELRAYCPPVQLREGTAMLRTYARGGQDDPTKLAIQASISDVTRSCSYGDGTITLNVAAAGRIIPGPAAQGGSTQLPIRIAVIRGEEVLYSQLHPYAAAVTPGQATQFLFSDPNVTIPYTGGRGIVVYAGFDEGPAPKTKKN